MSLANLFNIPNNEREFSVFSFNNANQHRQIVDAIFRSKGLTLPVHILDPIPFSSLSSWLELHQQMHNDFNAALGIAGVDLTDVDFTDPQQFASWSRLHGSEHMQAAQMLRLP